MSEPVRYWDNGNVKMPATYPSLLKECERLHVENQRLRKLAGLCEELDMEMDGVSVPASAAAILNAIRHIISEASDE